ncbi:phosphomannomutase/phosphoglucomutase [Hahella sp. CR1]|uniref:phosphomannomutase/phosphoglucomutase n=1 Tax=Hahella sp. CR1 TaxID=2992807 RepID=UPI0032612F30
MKPMKKKQAETNGKANGNGAKKPKPAPANKSKQTETKGLAGPGLFAGLSAALAAVCVVVTAFVLKATVLQPLMDEVNAATQKSNLDAAVSVINNRLKFIEDQVAVLAGSVDAARFVDDQVRAQVTGIATKTLPAAVRAVAFQKGRGVRDTETPVPVSFASLDMVRNVEQGKAVRLEAFVSNEKWFIQVVKPVQTDSNVIVGTVLVMFSTEILEPTWRQTGGGKYQLLQSVGGQQRVVIEHGQGSGDKLVGGTALPQWQVAYYPNESARFSYSDQMLWIVALAIALLAAGLAAAPVFLLTKKVRKDISAVTAFGQACIMGEKPSSPKISLLAFHSMVVLLDQARQTVVKRSIPTKSKATAADSGAEAAPAKKAPQPAKEEAAPLFNDDALDISMLGEDDDLLGLHDDEPASDFGEGASMEVNESQVVNVSDTIFRAYDIRGVVGDTLDAKVVYEIGRALGSEARQKNVTDMCLGYDGRESSPALAKALAQGIMATGVNVINVGLVPTPVLYFAAHHTQTLSGAMVTGSHNPAEYNGVKMMLAGDTLAQAEIQKLLQRIRTQNYIKGQGELRNQDIRQNYIDAIVNDIAVAAPLKVVLDAGNGVAGDIAPKLIEELGCEVTPLFCEVDGNFPNHHPDPGKPENLQALIAKVKEVGADIGVAFDGDGDRIGVVTAKGKIIWPDRLLMLFAKDVVSRNPGADVIFDVKCSRRLNSLISSYGGRPIMWRTGHSLIKAKMKETGALLAGEMSGHIFFKERWFGFDDGIYSAARLLEILGIDERNADAVFDEFPEDVSTPEINVAVSDSSKFMVMEKLSQNASWGDGNVSSIDGVRVEYADGWGLCRASNTTPVLVLRFEAESQEALARIQKVFRDQLLAVDPSLSIPF